MSSNNDKESITDDNNNSDNDNDNEYQHKNNKFGNEYNDSDGEDVNDLISVNEFSRIDRSLLHTGVNNNINNNSSVDMG